VPGCPITPHIERLVDLAIEEDLGRGDVTTDTLLLDTVQAEGRILAKEEVVICGLDVASYVFARVGPELALSVLVADGDEVPAGTELVVITGPVAPMLQAERTALNFLMRMSGVATAARRYVKLVSGTGAKARVVDTRKTVPGWRVLDKYAVACGGGGNHRPDLGSGVLIKDNHIAACGSVWEAVTRARRLAPHTLRVEVEVTTLRELEEALEAKPDVVLLDNMDVDTLGRAVQLVAGRVLTEASGGVTRETLAAIALTGVDLISVGALTHSARAADLSMEIRQV
jgi:nicotinate-nucleotide pyrophosphorylase (carboxylating)